LWPFCASDFPRSGAADLIRLRKLFDLLADHAFPPRPGLLLSEDLPRLDQNLPRPLSPENDERLLAELHRSDHLLAAALLLTRLTGMRLGETADLAPDCLHQAGEDRWLLHVPLGKLHTERWVPVDQEVGELVARLRFLRTLPPVAPAEFLLPRPKGRGVLCTQLRSFLADAAQRCGIPAHVVPHQLRHTYATSMLRAGVSLPGLMKLLGHRTANMTLRYLEITQQDLQREFQLSHTSPRHLLPLPAEVKPDPAVADAATVLDRLSTAIRLLDWFRQRAGNDQRLLLLARRLVRVKSAFQKFAAGVQS
jgi:integrase